MHIAYELILTNAVQNESVDFFCCWLFIQVWKRAALFLCLGMIICYGRKYDPTQKISSFTKNEPPQRARTVHVKIPSIATSSWKFICKFFGIFHVLFIDIYIYI